MVNPYIDKSQLHWLKTELNERDDDTEIILMHIPFTQATVEAGSSHELFTTLLQHPSVKLILAGHHHRNLVQSFVRNDGQEMIQAETDALVETPENWRLIRLTEKNILVSAPGTKVSERIIPAQP
jgi:3',5'-cyclic AMP phosphodiesterase CpdA